jgi:diaminohydroxyphosphoribosylaminopyrimidine deaminase / 5-amino-6-(5-phosphoribosylamino)uracil reductase
MRLNSPFGDSACSDFLMTNQDIHFMKQALELARKGEGLAAPNPMVGAVIVRDGQVVGEGFHIFEAIKHAEVIALEAAGELASGATLYCSLEPCCHHGRTPPCTDAMIEAGISRAIVAIVDPDSRVSGSGIRQLKDAGIEVVVGVCEAEAHNLNLEYFAAKEKSQHTVSVD